MGLWKIAVRGYLRDHNKHKRSQRKENGQQPEQKQDDPVRDFHEPAISFPVTLHAL
jgi:hypothetical protein